MEHSTITTYLRDTSALGTEAIETLRGLVQAHPYCAAYRVLYTLALGNVHSLQLPEAVQQTAVYVPDRFRLLTLTNQGEAEWVGMLRQHNERREATAATAEAHNEADGGFDLIDRYLDHQAMPTPQGDLPLYDATVALETLELMPDAVEEEPVASTTDTLAEGEDTPAEAATQDDLIDSFIEAERQGTLFVPDTPTPETRTAEVTVEKIRDSAFLTESLAKIYIKQHKYAQALSIIRDLSLKYPEKNIYFADQIRFLEKIIDYKTNKNN